MALLATHVRFALEIADRFGLDDVGEYCAGAAYPDSRYVTGISRRLTHFEDSPQDPFKDGLSGFDRGWAAHNYYDRAAGPLYGELLPWSWEELEAFNHVWCHLTGLKVVEDMVSYDLLGERLPDLRDIGCRRLPLGEEGGLMERYYRSLRELYSVRPTPDSYAALLAEWGVDKSVCDDVISCAVNAARDAGLKSGISGIFGAVMTGLQDDF